MIYVNQSFFFFLKCIEFPSPKPTESTTVSCNPLSFHFFCFFTSTHFAYSCNSLVFYYKFIYLFFFHSFFYLHTFCFEVLSLASWLTTLFLLSSECTETKKRDRYTLRNKWRRWKGCRNRGRRNKGKEEEMCSRDKYKEEEEKPR